MLTAFKQRTLPVLLLLGCIWAGFFALPYLDPDPIPGIFPRTQHGLWGIPLAPFIHGSQAHLISNTLGLLSFTGFVAWRGPKYFFSATALIILIGGLGVWLFGRANIHIGASGLIFGYFGLLSARSVFEKSWKSIVLANFVILIYGGILWGALPGVSGISWESHLFGFLSGVITAFLFGNTWVRQELVGKSKKK